jgi:hypothetical protein
MSAARQSRASITDFHSKEKFMAEQAQANPQGLMPIGVVASHNIAAVLGLDPKTVPQIETAIKDEINAMSTHFTLAIADVNTQYESELAKAKVREGEAIAAFKAEVAKIKSDFVWIDANKSKVVVAASVLFSLGALIGSLITRLV